MSPRVKEASVPPNTLPSPPAGGFLLNVLPALVWTLAIFIGGSGGVSNPHVNMPFGFDKWLHLGAFFGLQVLSYRAFRYVLPHLPVRTLSWWGSAASLFAGVALEILQSGLPDRSADYQDVVADALGALLGVLTLRLFT
jgi:VanZ family protein